MTSSIGGFFSSITSNPEAMKGVLSLGGQLVGGALSQSASGESVTAFETQAASARAMAGFNAKIERLNSERRVKQLKRESEIVQGRQQVEIATTGLAMGSKSFLQLQDEAISEFTAAILQEKIDLAQRESVIRFEGERAAQDALSRARAARTAGLGGLAQTAFKIGTGGSKLFTLLGGTKKETGSGINIVKDIKRG